MLLKRWFQLKDYITCVVLSDVGLHVDTFTVKMASSFMTVCSHCCNGASNISTLDSIRKP